MNRDTKVRIQSEIEAILKDSPQQLEELAENSGISISDLTNMSNRDTWTKVSSESWTKAATLFTKVNGWPLIQTENFQIIQDLCKEAQDLHSFFGIIGESGYGKTAALKHYGSTNKNAFYILANYVMPNRAFIQTICEAIGAEPKGDRGRMIASLCDRLNALEKPLLILDDFGKVVDSNYRLLQLIYDHTEGHCGIVVSGVPFLKDYIYRMRNHNKMGFDELSRRIQYWRELFPPELSEVAALCQRNGITDKQAIHYINNTCNDYGTIRNMITNAKRISKNPDYRTVLKVRVDTKSPR